MIKRAGIPIGGLVLIYFVSYVLLSFGGAYAPVTWSFAANGGLWPKDYIWLPRGFYDQKINEFQRLPVLAYAPLIIADRVLWHTHTWHPELTGDPMYPVPSPNQKHP